MKKKINENVAGRSLKWKSQAGNGTDKHGFFIKDCREQCFKTLFWAVRFSICITIRASILKCGKTKLETVRAPEESPLFFFSIFPR